MKKLILTLFLLMLATASPSVANSKNENKYVIPAISHLKFNNNKDGFYHFDGVVKVSVRYEIYSHKDYNHLIMIIHPDSKSLKSLPYLTLFDSSRQEPKNIYISNSKDLLPLITNAKTNKHLYRNNVAVYGTAILMINKFSGGYECDQLTFIADIKNLDSIKTENKYMKIQNSEGY